MLLRALLVRMHGGTDASSSRISSTYRRFSRLVYEKYTNLPNLVLDLLSSGLKKTSSISDSRQPQYSAHSSEAQKVLPAMAIIERSGLPSKLRSEIKNALSEHRQSPLWMIREKAAKTIAAVVEDGSLIGEIQNLLEVDRTRQNALHGSLLCARFMIIQLGLVSIGSSRSGQRCAAINRL